MYVFPLVRQSLSDVNRSRALNPSLIPPLSHSQIKICHRRFLMSVLRHISVSFSYLYAVTYFSDIFLISTLRHISVPVTCRSMWDGISPPLAGRTISIFSWLSHPLSNHETRHLCSQYLPDKAKLEDTIGSIRDYTSLNTNVSPLSTWEHHFSGRAH
jgi:hypothetical protein